MTLFSSWTFLSWIKTSVRAVDDRSHTKFRSMAFPTLLTVPCMSRWSAVRRCNFSLDLASTSRRMLTWSAVNWPSCGTIKNKVARQQRTHICCVLVYWIHTHLDHHYVDLPSAIESFSSVISVATSPRTRSEKLRIVVNLDRTRSSSFSTELNESFLSIFCIELRCAV